MEVRPASSPDEVRGMSTAQLRDRFLLSGLFTGPEPHLVYTHHDRIVAGGVAPPAGSAPVSLPNPPELRSAYFLERRELGVVSLGPGRGIVTTDGERHVLSPFDVLYVGRGVRDVTFATDDQLADGGGTDGGGTNSGARFALVSAQAHTAYPTARVTQAEAGQLRLGSPEGSNVRTIHQYIHADGVRSCELVLGVTQLAPGSMWNTMPCHVHDRRTEVYLYFGLAEGARVVHLMGEPAETRHLFVADGEAVVSPPWSVHCGFGTSSYAFVWAMAGENQAYTDVEVVDLAAMR